MASTVHRSRWQADIGRLNASKSIVTSHGIISISHGVGRKKLSRRCQLLPTFRLERQCKCDMSCISRSHIRRPHATIMRAHGELRLIIAGVVSGGDAFHQYACLSRGTKVSLDIHLVVMESVVGKISAALHQASPVTMLHPSTWDHPSVWLPVRLHEKDPHAGSQPT